MTIDLPPPGSGTAQTGRVRGRAGILKQSSSKKRASHRKHSIRDENAGRFQEIYDRIRQATRTRTQAELAILLGVSQASISEAKSRNSIPSDWYLKLFEQLGLNPDWLKNNLGPVSLRKPAQTAIPLPCQSGDLAGEAGQALVRDSFCAYTGHGDRPELSTLETLPMPVSFVPPHMVVLKVGTEAFSPLIRKGAYVGVDTRSQSPGAQNLFAVFMPHEGVALKRLFFDGNRDCFVLRTDRPGYPESELRTEDCEERLLGEVCWVLQRL